MKMEANRQKPRWLGGVVLAVAQIAASQAIAGDWPEWRGPYQNGYSPETAPVTRWSPDGENLRWKSDIGGRSTPIVMDGRVFFAGPVDEGTPCSRERVVCLDLKTGRTLWEYRFNVYHTDIVENRVGWPSVTGDPETGAVYCHTTGGDLLCLGRDGKLLWDRPLEEGLGRISGYGGRLITPLIYDDVVILSFLNSSWGAQGKGAHRYFAFDKRTGETVWWSAPGGAPLDTTYASPAVSIIGGRPVFVTPDADGSIYGLDVRNGEKLWGARLSKRGLNVSAVIEGNYAFVGHSEENYNTTEMGSVVCIDASKRGDLSDEYVWRHDGLGVGYCSPAFRDGRLYVVENNANLLALDAHDGSVIWEYSIGRVGKGSPVITADGVIYVGEQTGVFQILKDAGDHCEMLHSHEFRRPDGLVDEIFGSPAIADGAVIFCTRYGTYCLADKSGGPRSPEVPPRRHDSTIEPLPDGPVGFLVPNDVVARPGQTIRFEQRLLRPTVKIAPTWSMKGVPGELADNGSLTIADDAMFAGGVVTCKIGENEMTARVRVCPELPFVETFDELETGSLPPGWNSVGLRVQVVDAESGGKMLKKIAAKERPSPPFMRLQTYLTPPMKTGYAVQSDLKSELVEKGIMGYMPEMGVVNARNRAILIGGDPKKGRKGILRIDSWASVPRIQKDVEYDWKPDTWYTLKFDCAIKDGQGVLRAKVWPRDSAEPADWTLTVDDPCPNLEGSPGIYAYSTGTTARSDGPATYFDNVKVTPND
ncbi:MAG: PQQ-binding-like beta-propeller repeat protein [Phycisphaerales bacterium]|nr:PQQ-binding-like beta-propeller repeat protein [Phycisphaerales bacterium]